MATNSTAHALEPIPLRTLVVLLKYEFMISDPRYRKFGLLATSLSNPDMLEANRHMFKMDGRNRSLHRFLELDRPSPNERYPATTCEPHPNAGWDVQNLSWAEKELVFQETRNHDGCYKAIGLLQYFFDWCPAEQKIMIQIADEVSKAPLPLTYRKPCLVDMQHCRMFEFSVEGPKNHIRSTLEKRGSLPGGQHITPVTGSRHIEPHCVMGFLRPGCISVPWLKTSYYVADLARMQYGRNALGPRGETYFIGSIRETSLRTNSLSEMIPKSIIAENKADLVEVYEFEKSMKNVCENLTLDHIRATRLGDSHPVSARLKMCAERVFKRWNNFIFEFANADFNVSCSRDVEGWCEYCGKGGRAINGMAMKRCIGCRDKNTYYCCDQHQEAAWELHRLTCGAKESGV
ncbi:hypothetical protein JHW43_005577 [Diplocarpon mali]|nr:hypothetical protein JHW43_005577 [Diplocarpon mali]